MTTSEKEIDLIIQAAHALELDAPIINYRIVGNRIELWTQHSDEPYIYEQPAAKKRAPAKKQRKPAAKTSRAKKSTSKPKE